MNRLEKYKEIRKTRRRYVSLFLVFFSLLVLGACITDYALNGLMKDQKGINLVSLASSDTYAEISILNHKYYLNTTYISRDLERAKKDKHFL